MIDGKLVSFAIKSTRVCAQNVNNRQFLYGNLVDPKMYNMIQGILKDYSLNCISFVGIETYHSVRECMANVFECVLSLLFGIAYL